MPNRSGFYESTEAIASPPLQEALHAQVLNLSGLALACHPLLVVLFDSLVKSVQLRSYRPPLPQTKSSRNWHICAIVNPQD